MSSSIFDVILECNIRHLEYTTPTTQAMKPTFWIVMTHNQALHQSCSSVSLSPRALSRFTRDSSQSYRVQSTSCSSNVKCIVNNNQCISSTHTRILENTDIWGTATGQPSTRRFVCRLLHTLLRHDPTPPTPPLPPPTHFTQARSNTSSNAHTSEPPDHTTLLGYFSSPILCGPHGATLFCPLRASCCCSFGLRMCIR